MKKFLLLAVLPLLLSTSVLTVSEIVFTPQQAEAARFGGGRSFGTRPPVQQPRQAAPQQGMQQGAQRGGMLGGGMLGGLLAGSMLGALFFGGAFSGLGMADVFVILLLVFALSRLLRGRAQQQQRQAAASGGRYGNADDTGFARSGQAGLADQGGSDFWNRLRSEPERSGEAVFPPSRLNLPAGFNEKEFINGAKLMFNRLQESWDVRDLDDIAEFATPGVLREIERQADEDPSPSHTEIMQLEAELADYGQAGATDTAAVLFTALLRESQDENVHEVSEVWHFTRGRKQDETWKLDGIQQVN